MVETIEALPVPEIPSLMERPQEESLPVEGSLLAQQPAEEEEV